MNIKLFAVKAIERQMTGEFRRIAKQDPRGLADVNVDEIVNSVYSRNSLSGTLATAGIDRVELRGILLKIRTSVLHEINYNYKKGRVIEAIPQQSGVIEAKKETREAIIPRELTVLAMKFGIAGVILFLALYVIPVETYTGIIFLALVAAIVSIVTDNPIRKFVNWLESKSK